MLAELERWRKHEIRDQGVAEPFRAKGLFPTSCPTATVGEWATQNIRVNTLVPGFFPAEQNRKVLTPERVDQIMGHTPMKRFGNADELSGATLLLASGAGSFITGEILEINGGLNFA